VAYAGMGGAALAGAVYLDRLIYNDISLIHADISYINAEVGEIRATLSKLIKGATT